MWDPTSGITYSTNNSWFQDSGNYWDALAWDTNRYMNVYTNAVPCCYGYVSGFPSEGIAGQTDDRIVLWWEAVGRDATDGWPLNMGRTATHEVGHYLGLYHTFCGGCGTTSCHATGFSLHFTQAMMAAAGLGSGTTVYAQYFFRDPAHPDGSGVGHTDALEFCVWN